MRASRTGIAALLLTSAVIVAGCGGSRAGVVLADDAVRQVGVLAGAGGDDVLRLPRSGVTVPRPQLPSLTTRVGEQTEALVAPYVDDLDPTEARRVLRAACDTKDAVDLYGAENWQDAADVVIGRTNGPVGQRTRVASLANDLDDAESSGDVVEALASYTACEAV